MLGSSTVQRPVMIPKKDSMHGVDIPVSFRPNPGGNWIVTHTEAGNQYHFVSDNDRTIFLNTKISEGVFCWTVRIMYTENGNGSFCMGTAPTELLNVCDNYLVGRVSGTCNIMFIKTEFARLEGVENVNVNDFDNIGFACTEMKIHDRSLVTAEVDVSARTLSFFVNEKKVPIAVSNVNVPLYFGMAGWRGGSFTSVSFHRLPTATPSPDRCVFYRCKPMKVKK